MESTPWRGFRGEERNLQIQSEAKGACQRVEKEHDSGYDLLTVMLSSKARIMASGIGDKNGI